MKGSVSGLMLTLFLIISVFGLTFNVQSLVNVNPDVQCILAREMVEEESRWVPTDSPEKVWNFDRVNEWMDFAKVDGDMVEIVVGVNHAKSNSHKKLKHLIAENYGELVNTVLVNGEVIAVVAGIPLKILSSFAEETQAAEVSRYVEPNMRFEVDFVPNDLDWPEQWGPRIIEADSAWNSTIGDPSVLVAVVDTGIDWDHPDLAANYVPLGYDWVNNDTDSMDDHGHGTHCAGIIAATLNNSVGIAGLAQVRIMAEKGFSQYGIGFTDDLVNAIVHAVDQEADIVSMSWSGGDGSELLHEAIKYAYDAGVLLVAAAGNEGWDLESIPAAYEEVIAVAATDRYDKTTSWSNYGDWIELAAPGSVIYSTILNDSYAFKSGTSMACPHVAGVAALIWSQFPQTTRNQVRIQLRNTADDLGDPGFDVHYGYGRINARKAVELPLPNHDLQILSWKRPRYVEPESSGIINVTVLNFGVNNESDVTVQLLVNGSIIDSASIGLLESGASATFSYSWRARLLEGAYNVTSYVVPVSNETTTENNVVWAYIYVGFPVKASVLRSGGTEIDVSTWKKLNTKWSKFGSTIIDINYVALRKEGITYKDIAATGADVLIISCAYLWEYTDSEIHAIMRYIYEGHGLIVTSGTLRSWYVPNNNKLGRLLGLNETTTWEGTRTYSNRLQILDPTHPLFINVPNPYPMVAMRSTTVPSDLDWDSNELVGGTYVALGELQECAIVVYNGLVYISALVEWLPTDYDLQFLYNAITWSRYQKPEHELVTSVEAPKFLEPDDTATLNATVFNAGLNNETDVELQLLLDGAIIDSVLIPELVSGSFHTITYSWSPTVKASYNTTVYVPPVPNDDNPSNNRMTSHVVVTYPLIHPIEGQWAAYKLEEFDDTGELIHTEEWNYTYDHYISRYKIYVTQSIKISTGEEVTYWMIVNIMNRWIERGYFPGRWFEGWIETNITLGSTVNIFYEPATVVDAQIIEVDTLSIPCWKLNYTARHIGPDKMVYTFCYDRASGLLVRMDYEVTHNSQRQHYWKIMLIETNVPIGYEVYPMGDVNFDGIVDVYDIVICADAFHSQLGWPNWNPIVDLNGDGIIDIFDLVIMAVNYGKTYPQQHKTEFPSSFFARAHSMLNFHKD